MRIRFATGSTVEAVVTLAAAAMMTFAWLAMAGETGTTEAQVTSIATCVAPASSG
ncbi:MAG TPA: hypothetical protein VF304_15780 [Casimicrobiaceae bacterium]